MAERMSLGEKFEELFTQSVLEKIELVMQDSAEDYIRDEVRQTAKDVLEDTDFCADILRKIRAVDLERLVKVEIGLITARLLKGQLAQIIEEHLHLLLTSEEVRSKLVCQIGARIGEIVQSSDIASALDQLARQAVSSTLHRMSMGLFPGTAAANGLPPAESKEQRTADQHRRNEPALMSCRGVLSPEPALEGLKAPISASLVGDKTEAATTTPP